MSYFWCQHMDYALRDTISTPNPPPIFFSTGTTEYQPPTYTPWSQITNIRSKPATGKIHIHIYGSEKTMFAFLGGGYKVSFGPIHTHLHNLIACWIGF